MSHPTDAPPPLPFAEFVSLTALMMALVALSIDAMLPALSSIGADLGVESPNDNQLIVSILFLGLAVGQMIYGPLSDSRGRKPAVLLGFGLFGAGCLLSIVADGLPTMLAGRFIQGFGLAGPRVVSVALIRDQYAGDAMARVMSFVMAVFIFVPMIAPALGQMILWLAPWRAIFVSFLGLSLLICLWFMLRQPETLPQDRRIPFSMERIAGALKEICTSRVALGYTITAGFISSAFLGYLVSSQQILQQQYAQGDRFPLFFAALALCVGVASFLNGKLVLRYGMLPLTWAAVIVMCVLSAGFFTLFGILAGHPPLWLLMLFLMGTLFCIGILFGNLNALAMEPLGHIAGIGAAVVGSLTTFLSIPIGTWIGQQYDGTVLPLMAGFLACSLASAGTIFWVRGKEAA